MKLLKTGMKGVSTLLFVGILSVGVQLGASEQDGELLVGDAISDRYVQCNSPRPEICYELYQPVCAKRDTGVRCTTTPCPSSELVTYPNDCKACADLAVMGFVHGGTCQDYNITADLLRRLGV